MDVSRAQVSTSGQEVVLDDPDSDWRVRVEMFTAAKPAIQKLTVESRGSAAVTASTLAGLPIRQIASVAASALNGEGEVQYRMLALPRPEGARSWPVDHYLRVKRVAAWALATGRPGGDARAVADFWGVHLRTARRWIAQTR